MHKRIVMPGMDLSMVLPWELEETLRTRERLLCIEAKLLFSDFSFAVCLLLKNSGGTRNASATFLPIFTIMMKLTGPLDWMTLSPFCFLTIDYMILGAGRIDRRLWTSILIFASSVVSNLSYRKVFRGLQHWYRKAEIYASVIQCGFLSTSDVAYCSCCRPHR